MTRSWPLCLLSSTKPNSPCALCGRLTALIYPVSISSGIHAFINALSWILDSVGHVTCSGQYDNSNFDASRVLKKHLHIPTSILGPLGICVQVHLLPGWKHGLGTLVPIILHQPKAKTHLHMYPKLGPEEMVRQAIPKSFADSQTLVNHYYLRI